MENDRFFWLVTASPHEHRAISRGLGGNRRDHPAAGEAVTFHYPGFSLLLVHTGMGLQRTAEKLIPLLERMPCSGLVSIGYCGALRPALHTGDVILYSECGLLERRGAVRIWLRSTFVLLSLLDHCLRAGGLHPFMQRAVTSSIVVAGAGQKKRLGERTGAGIVDMESSAIFQLAYRRGVPRAAIRVVLDDMAQPLDGLEEFLDANGQFKANAASQLLQRAPGLALRLSRLSRGAGRKLEMIARILREELPKAQADFLCPGAANALPADDAH